MKIGLSDISIMSWIQRDSTNLNVSLEAWTIWQIMGIIESAGSSLSIRTNSIAKIRKLIHVEPYTWKLYFLI